MWHHNNIKFALVVSYGLCQIRSRGRMGFGPVSTVTLMQWRKSVKIIGGDETEPSKVAHIKKRIVA